MPLMTSAMISRSELRSGRSRLLAWLVCGLMAGAGHAQTGPAPSDAVVPAAPPAAGGADAPAGAPADTPTEAPADVAGTAAIDDAADLVPAEPVDPIVAGEQLLASNIEEFGRVSLQTAEAYIDLAEAHRQAKDYERAAENYLAAVEVYRDVDGPFTPLAIGPLTSLGDTYQEADDDVNAVASYTEARTVSRRVYGLHNEAQIELLDRMSRSFLDLNQLSEAEAQQVEALRLVQRSHPPHSDEVLEAIYKYAQWLGDRLQFQLERDQYTRALRIIRQAYGDDDVRQARPLLAIGNSYRRERNPASLGISALEDALALLLAQPERDYVATATALRDIGDWAVAFGKAGYDGTEYQRAWEMLGSAANGEELRREWFTGAKYVLYEPISPRGLSNAPEAQSGYVTVRFDIDTAGNSENVTLVDSSPAGLKDEAVLRHIRRSRFRPLVSNGQIVVSQNMAIRVTFRYLPEAFSASADED
jgi:TonB family protein